MMVSVVSWCEPGPLGDLHEHLLSWQHKNDAKLSSDTVLHLHFAAWPI